MIPRSTLPLHVCLSVKRRGGLVSLCSRRCACAAVTHQPAGRAPAPAPARYGLTAKVRHVCTAGCCQRKRQHSLVSYSFVHRTSLKLFWPDVTAAGVCWNNSSFFWLHYCVTRFSSVMFVKNLYVVTMSIR
jgi:hypothetical protein